MALYTIADLHLPLGIDKPMDIFGKAWENYVERLADNWQSVVKGNDVVVLPGDFSWATYLEQSVKDFEYLHKLNGKKILLKGNHDYWWTTVTSMKKFLEENKFNNIEFLYNNAIEYENKVFVGSRGWALQDTENSKKMINRECQRLELSIKDAINNYDNTKEIIAFMHYPPLVKQQLLENNHLEFYKVLKKYDIKKCYYGHLHGNSHKDAINGDIGGINFSLISADYLNFKLLKIN